MLAELQRDVLVLMMSRGVRAFAFSYLSIVFAIYLNQLGYSTVTIGLVISTAYASGALLTLVWGFLSDRYGRKKILMLLASLTIVSNLTYIFFSDLEERESAAGITTLSRHVPMAVTPTFSAYMMQAFSFNVPIF